MSHLSLLSPLSVSLSLSLSSRSNRRGGAEKMGNRVGTRDKCTRMSRGCFLRFVTASCIFLKIDFPTCKYDFLGLPRRRNWSGRFAIASFLSKGHILKVKGGDKERERKVVGFFLPALPTVAIFDLALLILAFVFATSFTST